MRSHILIAIFALVLGACASHRDVASTGENQNKAADQYTFRDAGSQFR